MPWPLASSGESARADLEEMICAAREHSRRGGWSADAAERAVVAGGRALELHVLQGFRDARAARRAAARADGKLTVPTDADGVRHRRIEADHARHRQNLYPGDAELNLPAGLHSHEVAKLAATESARGRSQTPPKP